MSQSEKSPDVQSIPRLKTASSPGERPTPAIDPQAVARLLEPSFETYHGRLRQELLAEFAILERCEERMRKDLFSRVNRVLGQANKRVDDAFLADRVERGRARRRQTLATLSAAAAILLGITVNAVFSWNTAQRAAKLERTSASVIGLMDSNRQDLAALRKDVMQNTADPEVAPASLTVTHGASESYAAAYPAELPAGAAALVSELHSMGILGPVKVETNAGSFCVRPTPNGFELAGSNVDLSDCEVLPIQLSAARRIQ